MLTEYYEQPVDSVEQEHVKDEEDSFALTLQPVDGRGSERGDNNHDHV